jgi:hypothetical protein
VTPDYQLPRFVHMGLNPRNLGSFDVSVNKKIESYLDIVADDWYRYGAQNYVLWTNKELASLSWELTQQPGLEKLYVLTTEFSRAQINGMMTPQFWEWFTKPR